MQVIYPHRRQTQQPARLRKTRSGLLYAGLALAGFVVLNLLVMGIYSGRTYPRTVLAGTNAGNKTFKQVETMATRSDLLPLSVTLARDNQKAVLKLSDIGAKPDLQRTKNSLKTSRSWLPVANLFIRHQLAAPIAIDNNQLNKAADSLAPSFHKAPENAKVTLKGATFNTLEARDGHELDQQSLSGVIFAGLDNGQASLTAPISTRKPVVGTAQAGATAKKLQDSLDTKLTYQFKNASKQPSKEDIASWYTPVEGGYALNDFAIRTFIAQAGVNMGVRASNLTAAVATTKDAVTNTKPATMQLTPFAATKTYRYCAAVKGASTNYLSSLKQELAGTYSDLRGWSLDGQIEYRLVDTGCDFTVWISAPSEMSSFGAICDDYWSCNVGTNVVINLDRWNSASDAWKRHGGSLTDYHIMAINHETGHMLGFGHPLCPGAGQPAPVMMQQSIDMQGCTFNIWPTASELDTLRRVTGL